MNELKPLSSREADLIIEYFSSESYDPKPVEFEHPTLGPVYVERITYAPFVEQDYKGYVEKIEKDALGSRHYWGLTYRIVVIVAKTQHLRSPSYLRLLKVFTLQEIQQLGIVGFEYPEDILEEEEFDEDDDD